MKITELVTKDTMIFDLQATDQLGVIDELASKLVEAGNVVDKDEFVKEIIAREEISTTAFGDGIAIPHAKTNAVAKPAICFGKSTNGAEYKAMDGNPVHLFFMIAAPADGGDLHLKALATLARKLIYPEFRQSLLSAASIDEVLAVLDTID